MPNKAEITYFDSTLILQLKSFPHLQSLFIFIPCHPNCKQYQYQHVTMCHFSIVDICLPLMTHHVVKMRRGMKVQYTFTPKIKCHHRIILFQLIHIFSNSFVTSHCHSTFYHSFSQYQWEKHDINGYFCTSNDERKGMR